jgi:hypothetical protein
MSATDRERAGRASQEYDLIWSAATYRPGSGFEPSVLAQQIDDIEVLRDLVAMFAASAALLNSELQDLASEDVPER